jgi:hypothetical protein
MEKGDSTRPKDVLELGRVIVRQLELETPGEMLTRWMAHHLAELIESAARNEGAAKQQAEDRAVELILKLWTNRRALPVPADPLSGHRDAIAVLATMMPSADPWGRYRRGSTDDELLHEMFSSMAQLVMGGLLLTRETEMRALENAEWEALAAEERFLVELLVRWHRFFANPAPKKLKVEILYKQLIEGNSDASTEAVSAARTAEAEEPDALAEQRAVILSNIETFHERLEDLIERWREKTAPDEDTADGVAGEQED